MAGEGPQRASAIQQYRFVRRLAVGGMAEVYAADAIGVAGVKKRVALKRILPGLARDPAFVEMFGNEARVASTLQHPNIVQTYDVIDDGGELYIAMELLEGLTLLDLRARAHAARIALTPGQVLYVVDRVLSGLHYAHERRTPDGRPLDLVHRDVSPHNVFLTREGNVKLLDFGVAKVAAAIGREATGSGVVKGKVLYMSPEQCQGLDVDRTSDTYAVGALLYVLLTGQHPFRGANPFDTMRAILYNEAPPPSSLVPALGPAVDGLVARAMAKVRADRFPTARDMQYAVAAIVRERGWVVTDLDFASLVEALCPRDEVPDVLDLPSDLVIGDRAEPEPEPEPLPAPEAAVAETESAVVERVRGLTVLTLRGRIDERFDASVAAHLRGVVLVDTGDVRRITSYGLRALLEVFERSAGQVDAVYHLRCAVPFLQQVAMIRRLLGGGQIVSLHLPYVDPVTNQPFERWVGGAEAAAVLASRRPPATPCPADPRRLAEFDEDPEVYLDLADAFCAEPPDHVAQVIEALSAKEKRRQVEKAVTPNGLVVYIRRPLDEDFRWRSLLAGAEGRVRLDLEAMPTWTEGGLSQLVSTLAQESVAALELTHMPVELYSLILRDPRLGPALRGGSIRAHAHCPTCRAPRRLAVDLAELSRVRQLGGRVTAPCPRCRTPLVVFDDGRPTVGAARPIPPGPAPAAPIPAAPIPAASSSPARSPWRWVPWAALAATVVGVGALAASLTLFSLLIR